MTSVTTNVASLNAQYNLNNINKDLDKTMVRLSTGKRINSAGDDAAGVSIVSRMNSQINGLSQAIRNANDGISLIKTSEGALTEVSNMLQRMRELAVQASNGTNNSADQATLDLEVQQLKTEIDRIASSTQFNSQNVLDGTFKKVLQIGDGVGHTLDLKLGSVKTSDLGMGGTSSGGSTLVSTRIGVNTTDYDTDLAIQEGDIKINGQDVGEIADNSDMEDILKAINDNVDNVTATGFNVITAKNVGNGVTADGEFDLIVKELGQGTATTFNISASDNLTELVDNINNETGNVVQASINSDGKLVLSNETGASISVTDGSTSNGSGFEDGATVFGGFIKLTADDSNPIRVEIGNLHAADEGVAADLAELGFRETTKETDGDAYTLTGIALTDTTTAWGNNDIKINGVQIYDADIDTDSFQGRLDAINNFSEDTGVVASAWFEKLYDWSGVSFLATDKTYINGTAVTLAASIDLLVSNINAAAGPEGITATRKGDNIILSGAFKTITLRNTDSAGTATAGATYFGAAANGSAGGVTEENGGIRLDSTKNQPISVELGDSHTVGEHGFLEANVGAADFEVNVATLGASSGSSLSGLGVSDTSSASAAITTLDNAINSVDKMRGDLGSLNNRLDYTVTNLSNIVLNTQSARGQIEDANFADETTNLIKGQILAQAATSMLAQANQSKQSLLALLQ